MQSTATSNTSTSVSLVPNESLSKYLNEFTDKVGKLEDLYRSLGTIWHRIHIETRERPELNPDTSTAARAAHDLFMAEETDPVRDISADVDGLIRSARGFVRRGEWAWARSDIAEAEKCMSALTVQLDAADEAIETAVRLQTQFGPTMRDNMRYADRYPEMYVSMKAWVYTLPGVLRLGGDHAFDISQSFWLPSGEMNDVVGLHSEEEPYQRDADGSWNPARFPIDW